MPSGGHGWWNSMQTFLQRFNQPGAPPSPKQRPSQPQHAPPAPQMESGDAMGVLIQSARRNTLALLLYHGNWRYVEPYSIRHRKNGTDDVMMFCHRHQRIEAFKPNKIEAAQITDVGFKPRWPVELK